MAQKSVVWTATAIRQRREILKYWTIHNASSNYSLKLIDLIKNRISVIANNPLSGKATNHPGTRESAMGNFSLYYKIFDHQIIITAFWDNRQDSEKAPRIITNYLMLYCLSSRVEYWNNPIPA